MRLSIFGYSSAVDCKDFLLLQAVKLLLGYSATASSNPLQLLVELRAFLATMWTKMCLEAIISDSHSKMILQGATGFCSLLVGDLATCLIDQ